MKRLIIFDLDGTLAESKSSVDAEMAALLSALLEITEVAIISGGAWLQFERQILSKLPEGGRLTRLSLLPTCGTKFYRLDGTWRPLYSEDFKPAETTNIIAGLHQALKASGFQADKVWGELVEDRGSQITFSALGQQAPLCEKTKWDPDFAKRRTIKALLEPLIPGFSVQFGGSTSIDITRQGIDKGYGIGKLKAILDIPIAEMVFIGDALFPGGNDYPAKQAGVASVEVRNPSETKPVIKAVIACLGDGTG